MTPNPWPYIRETLLGRVGLTPALGEHINAPADPSALAAHATRIAKACADEMGAPFEGWRIECALAGEIAVLFAVDSAGVEHSIETLAAG